MDIKAVRETTPVMPLTNSTYPPGPYRFIHREFLITTCHTDPAKLRAMVPEPLEVPEPLVACEFIRMADSAGFGDYTESGQIIPITYEGKPGTYTLAMYPDDHPPLASGHEMWGFPKKLASPRLLTDRGAPIDMLDCGPVRVAADIMSYKYRELDLAEQKRHLECLNFLFRVIPHVDGKTTRICELSRNVMIDIGMRGAWTGPVSLELTRHALTPVAELPMLEIVEAQRIIADLTLGMGKVMFDYLAQQHLPKVILIPVTTNPRNTHMSDLKGKVVIVTGAASDVGKQIALALANSGAAIAIADLNEDSVRAVAKEITNADGKAIGLRMDVTDEQAMDSGIDRVAEELGPVDILISNTGIQIVNPFVSYSFAGWKEMQAIHVGGAFLTTHTAPRHMYKDDHSDVVIYMGLVHSHGGSPLKPAYVVAKYVLLDLDEALAKEDTAHNVRSHVVCPGSVCTSLAEKQIPEQAKELDISEKDAVKKVTLGSTVDDVFTTVEDAAGAVCFLATFPSTALIGQSFVVSHG